MVLIQTARARPHTWNSGLTFSVFVDFSARQAAMLDSVDSSYYKI